MEIDWSSISFEIETIPATVGEVDSPMDLEDTGSNDTTLTATETGDVGEALDIDDMIVMDTDDLIVEERFSDDEDVPLEDRRNPLRKARSNLPDSNQNGDESVRCETCSLDLPSLAYLKRHLMTKKHIRAIGMEMRGRKVNQKKRYVRKCERLKRPATSTDLTSEEVELLQIFDDQIQKLQTETSAKDFYENFDFDLDFVDENLTGMDTATQDEILNDLIATSGEFFGAGEQFDIVDSLNIPSGLTITPVAAPPQTVFIQPTGPTYIQSAFTEVVDCDHNNNSSSSDIKPNSAKPSSASFQNLQNILSNLRSKSATVEATPVATTVARETNVQHECRACNKFFSKRCHYTQHMNIVHSDRRHRCQKCGKKYATAADLSSHMLRHSDNKPFKCAQCDRSYNNKIDLRRHEKLHMNFRQHNCEICGRGFVRHDHLQKHYLVHEKRAKKGRKEVC